MAHFCHPGKWQILQCPLRNGSFCYSLDFLSWITVSCLSFACPYNMKLKHLQSHFLFLPLIDKFTFTKFKQLIQILLCWWAGNKGLWCWSRFWKVFSLSLPWHWDAQHFSFHQNTHEVTNEISGSIKIYFDCKSGICLFVDCTCGGLATEHVLGKGILVWPRELFTH